MKPLPILVFITISLSLTGCFLTKATDPKPADPAQPTTTLSKQFSSQEDLKPTIAPPKEANLILNGTVIPVTLRETRKDNSITYSWIVDDAGESGEPVEVESEKYFASHELFSFSATAHERYNPAINLLRYPLTVGDTWDWNGEVIVGVSKRKASAKIETSAAQLNLPNTKITTLLVKVTLTYEATQSPGTRELKFWFKPGEGLVRRELWGSSTREPRTTMSTQTEGE